MTMSHDKARATSARESIGMSPPVRGQLFENDMDAISESMEGMEFDSDEKQIGRLSIDERPYHLSGYSRNETEVGRLSIDERAWKASDAFTTQRDVGRLNVDAPGGHDTSDPFESGDRIGSGFILETPTNSSEEEKKSDVGGSGDDHEKKPPHSSKEGKGVPTPARALLSDETEWRDFISSGKS